MSIHLEREIEKLNALFIRYTILVEETFANVVEALTNSRAELAREVIEKDREIDMMEIEVEEECLKILALHQPVAIDLRYIISILKINNDLERIGDLSSNISERLLELLKFKVEPDSFLISKMCMMVKKMLKNSLDCVIHKNMDLAKQVLADDNSVDNMHSQMYELVGNEMKKGTFEYDALNQYISISRFLERIADHSTNIAEDLIYMIDGTIIRHHNLIFSNQTKSSR